MSKGSRASQPPSIEVLEFKAGFQQLLEVAPASGSIQS